MPDVQTTSGRIRVALRRMALTVLALYLGIAAWMVVEARSQAHEPGDVVLILGAAVHDDRPSQVLQRRIDRAAAYMVEHPAVSAVACGGRSPGDRLSEAEVIRNELVRRGVAGHRIDLEMRSTSTAENLRFALPLVRARLGAESGRVLIATSNFHLARAKLLARALGLDAYGLPAATPLRLLPWASTREVLAIVKALAVDLAANARAR